MNDFKSLTKKLERESRVWECFCGSDKCHSQIKKAHSIQNNKILSKISENGNVIQLKRLDLDVDDKVSIDLEKVGRKKATISTNFCGYHDTKIFIPIESKNYNRNDREQEFLFAYRAFAKEYHVKRESKLFYENIIKLDKDRYKDYFTPHLIVTNKTLEQLEKERIQFNTFLNNSDFRMIGTYIIEFHGSYEIAASSSFAIEYDLQGNLINDLSNLNKELKRIFLNVFPQGNKTFIILSFYQKDKKLFSFISNQIMQQSINKQKIIVSNLLLSHVENLVLSPRLWSKLLPEEQVAIKQIFARTIDSFENNLSNLKDINLFI